MKAYLKRYVKQTTVNVIQHMSNNMQTNDKGASTQRSKACNKMSD